MKLQRTAGYVFRTVLVLAVLAGLAYVLPTFWSGLRAPSPTACDQIVAATMGSQNGIAKVALQSSGGRCSH